MIRQFFEWLTDRLPAREIRGDNGERYLERYYLGRLFGLTFYIHRFLASDPDRGLHDHPWDRSMSLVLAGEYAELRCRGLGAVQQHTVKRAPAINVIRGTDFHRVILPDGNRDVWTLFLHGQRVKKWGFLQPMEHDCKGQPYMLWMQYIYNDGDDGAGTWWKRCPKGRELRAQNTSSGQDTNDRHPTHPAISRRPRPRRRRRVDQQQKGNDMKNSLIRAAELLEEEAQALFEAHTLAGQWEPSEYGNPAQKKHAELIAVGSELRFLHRCVDITRERERQEILREAAKLGEPF